MTTVKELEQLDPDMKVSEMTVGQLLEAILFKETAQRAEALVAEYQQKVNELDSIRESSKSLFKDVENLTHHTTPFEIKTMEDVAKLNKSLVNTIEANQTVVMAMALRDK